MVPDVGGFSAYLLLVGFLVSRDPTAIISRVKEVFKKPLVIAVSIFTAIFILAGFSESTLLILSGPISSGERAVSKFFIYGCFSSLSRFFSGKSGIGAGFSVGQSRAA